jgi:hypothetical protein
VRLVGLVFGLAPRAIGPGVDSFKALARGEPGRLCGPQRPGRDGAKRLIPPSPRPQRRGLRRALTKSPVAVEGHLARHAERRRVTVIAHRAWSIGAAPPPPEEPPATGTHASPGNTSGRGMREKCR